MSCGRGRHRELQGGWGDHGEEADVAADLDAADADLDDGAAAVGVGERD